MFIVALIVVLDPVLRRIAAALRRTFSERRHIARGDGAAPRRPDSRTKT
jgi:hypothetical protein